MEVFCHTESLRPEHREQEHGGIGPIQFRRLMDSAQFCSPIDFIDFTTVPAHSTIGRHYHFESEELYFVIAGEPLINVNGLEQRAKRGTLSVVRSGEWHELLNDTFDDVVILVVQVRIPF